MTTANWTSERHIIYTYLHLLSKWGKWGCKGKGGKHVQFLEGSISLLWKRTSRIAQTVRPFKSGTNLD